jgi:pimeloyl-ACP methyl ester carboxylesterase
MWFDHPSARRWTERLASFARLILFDKRGTGLSDRTERVADCDRRMRDVRAVMDTAGSEQAVILGVSEGGAMAALLAASEPARVSGLVLYGTCARFSWAPDYPYGFTAEQLEATVEFLEREWGSGAGLGSWAPSVRNDPAARR